jgi:hemoglobin
MINCGGLIFQYKRKQFTVGIRHQLVCIDDLCTSFFFMKTIDHSDDLTLLLKTFYSRVGQDELLAPFFAELDMEEHLPRIVAFWASLLFGEGHYSGNMMDTHVHVNSSRPLTVEAFGRWLSIFHATTTDLFTGEKAEEMKRRATQMAQIMSLRLNGSLLN